MAGVSFDISGKCRTSICLRKVDPVLIFRLDPKNTKGQLRAAQPICPYGMLINAPAALKASSIRSTA